VGVAIAQGAAPGTEPDTSGAAAAPFPDFEVRPFPAAVVKGRFAWADADGKDPGVIRRLAHNPVEQDRLLEENSRVLRRQLVYLEVTTDRLIQRARVRGEPLTAITLPGLDGTEVSVEVERVDLDPSGEGGALMGWVAGEPDSLVTVAFYRGREAFTVLAPGSGLYLQGHPREPGQVMVTSFDPDTYLPLPCGEPIRTTP
jgi:hypothetical protein